MKANDPSLSPASASRTSGAAHASAAAPARALERPADAANSPASAPGDDVHLSELVRSLRALAAESPERQAKIEQLARAYAEGRYGVDAEATASAILDESTGRANRF